MDIHVSYGLRNERSYTWSSRYQTKHRCDLTDLCRAWFRLQCCMPVLLACDNLRAWIHGFTMNAGPEGQKDRRTVHQAALPKASILQANPFFSLAIASRNTFRSKHIQLQYFRLLIALLRAGLQNILGFGVGAMLHEVQLCSRLQICLGRSCEI